MDKDVKIVRLIGLLLAGALALCAMGVPGANATTSDPSPVIAEESPSEAAETAAEAAEDAAEAGEEADELAAPAQSDLTVFAHPAHHQKRIEGLRLRIQMLKHWIASVRATRTFVKGLPHTTVRWREHKPRETERIREYRARVRVTRNTIRELKQS